MGHDVVESQTFWDCVMSMQRDDRYQADLLTTMIQLRRQPFRNPVLQTHDVGTARNGRKIYSSDVGGRKSDRRLVWQYIGQTVVVLLYGTHAVQDRAKRMRIDFDPDDKVVTVYEAATDTGIERSYQEQRQQVGTLFMAWTDTELEELGFPEPTVAVMRTLDSDTELLDLAESMGPEHFEMAFNLVAFGNVAGEDAALEEREALPEITEAEAPEPTEEDRELERYLADPRAGAWFTRTEPEFLREVMAKPIEDWMIFLHPDQRAIVTRNFEGPAQVRGSAGTGKTVVGLHRAAWLAGRNRGAEKPRPVLFTTFIKSLPPVFESLYERMPGAEPDGVEFVHIDRLALQICRQAGEELLTKPRDIDSAYSTALRRIVYPGTPLGDAGFTPDYLREEVTAVIKGRAISSIDEYLEIRRTGRRAPMGGDQRRQVWELMGEWDAEMAKRGTVDFPDVVLVARDHARRLDEPLFSAAVIDEAQDLSLAALDFVRALVNAPSTEDRRNGLLLLGDGAQRIYAGGFTLGQAGIEVRGRSTILRTNYRNTEQIIATAMAVTGDQTVDDHGEEFRRGDAPAATLRAGARPLLIKAADLDDQIAEVDSRIRTLDADEGYSFGDIGVLVPTNRLAKSLVEGLTARGLSVQGLDRYDGKPNDKVKVGTYHRGKGLEFKAVFLPVLSKGIFPRDPDPDQTEDEAAEAAELAMSQLFVAMTRARDVLVVLYDREPSSTLAPVLNAFEQVTP